MKITVDLDVAEKDVNERFVAKKTEGAEIETRIKADQARHQEILQDMIRLQGEHKAIQNLRKQADITNPTPAEETKHP